MSDLNSYHHQQIFLIQVNGILDFCYFHLPTGYFYDIDNLYHVENIPISNGVIVEITSDLVAKFTSQAFLIIDENGFDLATGKSNTNLKSIFDNRDINIENVFIRHITLPDMKNLFSIEFFLSRFDLPTLYTGFENNLSPLLPPPINLIYTDSGPRYEYSDEYYVPVCGILDTDKVDYSFISRLDPNEVYYILKSSDGFAIVSISHITRMVNVLFSHCISSKLVDIIRLTQPNMRAVIPNVLYHILPYKQCYLNFDPIVYYTLGISSDCSIDQFITILSKILSTLNRKYYNISSQDETNNIPHISAVLPEFIILNGDIIHFISLFQVQQLVEQNQIDKCYIDPELQYVAGEFPNKIITIRLKNNTIHLVKAKLDAMISTIYNPE